MEQTTQKLPLPIKTKIAAKWLRIYSIIYLIFAGGLYILSFPFASMGGYPPKPYFLGLLLLLLFPLFILLFASGVLRGHKWAWRGGSYITLYNYINSYDKFYYRYLLGRCRLHKRR